MNNRFMSDQEARNIVINRINQNVFTPAGAGSGKTTSLVKRLITIVKEGRKVDKICTITFTVNAANEFYQRFQELLIEEESRLKKEKGSERELSYIQNALKDIDKCFMGTIDSFFQQILRENSANTNVSSSFEITDDDTYNTFIGDYFDKISRNNDVNIKTLIDLFGKDAKEFFKDAVSNLLPLKEYEIEYEKVTLSDINELEGLYKARILDCISYAISNPGIGENCAKEKQIELYRKLKDYKELNCDWSTNISRVYDYLMSIYEYNCNTKTAYKELHKKLSIEEESFFDEVKTLFGSKGEINSEVIPTIGNYKATVLLDACVKELENIQKEKELKGIYTFKDVTKAVYDMLIKDANGDGKIIRRIQEKYECFLLDEFQDTHPMCSEIFYILSSKVPCADWTKCEPKDGSLFIVGDSKQSIYRFNGADIEAFNRIKDRFEANEYSPNVMATLTKNFRSNDKLKEWFNKVFANIFVKGKFQTDFDAIELEHNPKFINKFKLINDKTGEIEETDNPVFKYQTDKNSDSENVLNIVNTLVDNENYLIKSKGGEVTRKIKYSDFMILTRSKENLDMYASNFAKNNIPFYVEGYNDFAKSESFVSIYNILTAICYGDSLSLYRALKSKPIGLSEEYLLELNNKGLLDLNKINEIEKNSYVYNIYKKLIELREESYKNTLSNIYERVMIDFDCINRCSFVSYNFAFSALENLRNAEVEGKVSSLEDGIKLLEGFLDEYKERVLNLEVKQNAIHLANLHKVKGLEAPIVILAYAYNSVKGRKLSVDNINKKVIPMFFEAGKNCTIKNSLTNEAKELEKKASEEENIRLLYVAATRAHNVLIISKIKTCNYWDKLLNGEERDFVIEDRKPDIVSPKIPSYGFAFNSIDVDRVAKGSYEIIKPSMVHAINKDEENADEISAMEEIKVGFSTGKAKNILGATTTGTIVHKLMEVLVNSKFNMDVDNVIKETLNEANVLLELQKELVCEFRSVINTMLDGGYKQEKGPADLVKELDGAVCYTEIPFAFSSNAINGIVNGVIDLLYYKDGKYHIVDYKTDSEFSNIDMRHEEQLKLYEEAVKKNLGEVIIDSRIYHIAI